MFPFDRPDERTRKPKYFLTPIIILFCCKNCTFLYKMHAHKTHLTQKKILCKRYNNVDQTTNIVMHRKGICTQSAWHSSKNKNKIENINNVRFNLHILWFAHS